ncbi:MAG: hypothetical protein ACN6OP_21610, partial [Pseudomonadales bacterium]
NLQPNAETFVARGLAPVRLRSSRKTIVLGVPDTPRLQVLGLLRNPAGASSLATGGVAGQMAASPDCIETTRCTLNANYAPPLFCSLYSTENDEK